LGDPSALRVGIEKREKGIGGGWLLARINFSRVPRGGIIIDGG